MGEPAAPTAVSDEDLLARFRRSKRQPAGSVLLGFEMIAVNQAERRVEITFLAREDFANPMGQIQGGYLCAMRDDAMSVSGLVTSGMTHVMPTLEMKTSFLRPALANGQKLRGIGRVVRWGKTIAFLEGELYDAAGELVAKASATAQPREFKSYKT